MTWNRKIAIRRVSLLVFLISSLQIMNAQDIFSEIEDAFIKGNTELLRNQFDEKIKLIVLGESTHANKTEAIKILDQFFKKYPVLELNKKFESEKSNSNFIIRTMKSKDSTFRITIFFKKTEKDLRINLLRIEKENESVF